MELALLGLGLPPATVGHGAGHQLPDDVEKTAAFVDDEPPRLAPPPAVLARGRRRPVDDTDVPAPPANKLMALSSSMPPWPAAQPTSTKVSVPGAAGDDKSPRASQLGCFRGIFPSTPSELARVHASSPPQGASAPAVNVFGGRPPPVVAGSSISSISPLTIIYDGSVHAFDSVPMEQAEKILFMTAKEAQAAAETPVFQQPPPAAAPPTSAAQMVMLLGLANVEDSFRLKRTLSLSHFLHKRRQRVKSAATATYPRVEELPTPMDPCAAVYALDKSPFGDMGQTWASEDGPKSQKGNHGEEEVNTELKI